MATPYRQQLFQSLLAEIRKALAEEKLTQMSVGQALGLKQSAVSSLLSGKTKMTLEQFLILADLLGKNAATLLQDASNRHASIVPMTREVEEALYRSELHLLTYCAATRPVSPAELERGGFTKTQVQQALADLSECGLLVERKGKWTQKDPQITYRASSRAKPSMAHYRIVNRAWQIFDRRFPERDFISTKFNAYVLDRFTVSQTKEIEAALWKVYERIQGIQAENTASGYAQNEAMPLWNVHLMLMTPLDSRA
jgi:predicted transcriptional regulator